MSDEFICPSHQQQRPHWPDPDRWDTNVYGDDRTCSYCGSWHPDDFLAFLIDAADPEKQLSYIEHSTKNYKIYIHRPGISNASQGAIKFYKWHLPEDIDEATQSLYREALETSFRKSMAIIDQACLNIKMMGDRNEQPNP